MIHHRHPVVLVFLLIAIQSAVLSAQGNPGDIPLGDVVKRQPKPSTPAKVITEEELGVQSGFVKQHDCSFQTNPCTEFEFLVPRGMPKMGGAEGVSTFFLRRPNGRLLNVIGSSPLNKYTCRTLDCAENVLFVSVMPSWLHFTGKESYRSTTTVDGFPARNVTFIAESRVMTKRGVAVFVELPDQVIELACMYDEADFDPAQTICQTIVDSLHILNLNRYRPDPPDARNDDDDSQPDRGGRRLDERDPTLDESEPEE